MQESKKEAWLKEELEGQLTWVQEKTKEIKNYADDISNKPNLSKEANNLYEYTKKMQDISTELEEMLKYPSELEKAQNFPDNLNELIELPELLNNARKCYELWFMQVSEKPESMDEIQKIPQIQRIIKQFESDPNRHPLISMLIKPLQEKQDTPTWLQDMLRLLDLVKQYVGYAIFSDIV
jgi:hypothetical protein